MKNIFCLHILQILIYSTALPLLAANPQPNLVIIMVDDLDSTASIYWEKAEKTGMDDPLKMTKKWIKDQGVTFSQAFAPTPICCPARATLLTGKLGHNTGVLNNQGNWGGWPAFYSNGNEEKTIAVALQKSGYNTALIGKYLNGIEKNPKHIPPGWSQWFGAIDNFSYRGYHYDLNENGELVSYGGKAKDYFTDVISAHAQNFLKDTEKNDAQPFFLFLTPTAPHFPIPPAPRHKNHPHSQEKLPKTPNFKETDMSDKSPWLRDSKGWRNFLVSVFQQYDYCQRQGSLYAVDEMVNTLMKQLEEQNELDHTYVMFLSDNGYNLGSHSLIQKMAPYEESIRIPFVLRGPGISADSQIPQMVLLTDLAPTMAQWAGIFWPEKTDGVSLVPLLLNRKQKRWREDFLVEYIGGEVLSGMGIKIHPWMNKLLGLDFPTYKALRTLTHTYVRYDIQGKIQKELYDLTADPYQLNNLLTENSKIDLNLYTKLQKRLETLTQCAGENCFTPEK